MRSFLIAILPIFLVACDQQEAPVTAENPQPKVIPRLDANNVFPLERALMSPSGKVSQATLLGRSKNQVMFIRKSDQQIFSFNIAELYHADQTRILKLPLRPYLFPKASGAEATPEQQSQELTTFRSKELDKFNAQLSDLSLEFDWRFRNNGNSAATERIKAQIAELKKKIERIESTKLLTD